MSDVGNRYTVNEDAVGWDRKAGVFVVADGMGGHAAGEVASAIVRDTLLQSDPLANLKRRVLRCHEAICAAVAKDGLLAGMGSTVIAAQTRGNLCDLVWVGDSRAYRWRRQTLTRLSADHSLVQEMLDRGEITPTQARRHPQRNIITQTLGINRPQPDQRSVQLAHKDWLLLCSDGLTDELSDDRIASILSSHSSIDSARDALMKAALKATGRDNITILLLQYYRVAPAAIAAAIAIGVAIVTGALLTSG
ncbi:MAG: PP2C family serine/threonine-protein phosphatase [Pseudomonadales bacterium]